jgi:hypothetical protein
VSDFFDSEMVKRTMDELQEMQDKLLLGIFNIPYYSIEEKKEYLKSMKDFLEKQKNLLFRMSLSDDPQAQIIKEQVLEAASLFGSKEVHSMDEYFKVLDDPIKMIEKSLDL